MRKEKFYLISVTFLIHKTSVIKKAEYYVQWAERLDVETTEFILHSEVEKSDG